MCPMEQSTVTPPALMTIPEVANELRLTRSTVYRLIGRGELPTVHVGGHNASRVRRVDLAAYIERNTVERAS